MTFPFQGSSSAVGPDSPPPSFSSTIETHPPDVALGSLRHALSHRLTADDVMLRSFNAESTNQEPDSDSNDDDGDDEGEDNYVALSQCASGGGHGNHRLSTRCEILEIFDIVLYIDRKCGCR